MCAGAQGRQKRTSGPLRLELQVVLSVSMWVLEEQQALSTAEPSPQPLV